MKLVDVKALEERARAEYEEKLRAIAIVRRMLEQENQAQHAGGDQRGPTSEESNQPDETGEGLSAAIIFLMEVQDRLWTVPQLVNALPKGASKSSKPERSVGAAMYRLTNQGRIKVVRRGSGRRPHRYKATKWVNATRQTETGSV